MPWRVGKDESCPGGWAVFKKADGKRVGCAKSRADALQQMRALYANTASAARQVVFDQIDGDGLTAAGAGLTPLHPPAAWFDDPHLRAPTPLTVTADGQVFGHLALWESCHIGEPRGRGVCVPPPRTRTDYAYFHLGETLLDNGESVATGKITLDTGHAGLSLSRAAAAAHYDDTGTAVADIRAGEDRYGIWIAGAIRPELPAHRIRALRAASLSGDWRAVGGNLEMVAALAVNVPGFPVPRPAAAVAASIEGHEELSLVAAGIVTEAPPAMSYLEYEERLDALGELADGWAMTAATPNYMTPDQNRVFVENLHPRFPKGTPQGGKFRPKYGDAVATPEGEGTVVGFDTGEKGDDTVQVVMNQDRTPGGSRLRKEFAATDVIELPAVNDLQTLLDRHAEAVAALSELPVPSMWDPHSSAYHEAQWELTATERDIGLLEDEFRRAVPV